MTISRIEFVYGVLVPWKSLKDNGFIPTKYMSENQDKDIENYHDFCRDKDQKILNMEVFYVPHDLREMYWQKYPSRLPVLLPPRNVNEEMVCVGVKVGQFTAHGDDKEDVHPTIKQIKKATKEFKSKMNSTLTPFAGKPQLHLITDDCACCS